MRYGPFNGEPSAPEKGPTKKHEQRLLDLYSAEVENRTTAGFTILIVNQRSLGMFNASYNYNGSNS